MSAVCWLATYEVQLWVKSTSSYHLADVSHCLILSFLNCLPAVAWLPVTTD